MTAVREVWTNDAGSMAHETAAKRWAIVVRQMKDDMASVAESSEDVAQKAEGMTIVDALEALATSISSNEQLR
jgi:hypothetical protein